jgi:hypothetical protein
MDTSEITVEALEKVILLEAIQSQRALSEAIRSQDKLTWSYVKSQARRALARDREMRRIVALCGLWWSLHKVWFSTLLVYWSLAGLAFRVVIAQRRREANG